MILFQSILTRAIVSPFPPGLCRDGMDISSRLFSAPTGAACAAGPGNGVPRPDFRGRDRLPVPVPAVKTQNGRGGLASGRHTHKSQSPEFLAMAVLDHVRGFNPAKRFKNLAQIVPRNVARQITYADIHSMPFPLPRTPVFRGRAKPKEMIRETGLEAGDAVRGARSCFKASSGDHPRLLTTLNQSTLYYSPAHRQVLFLFFSSKIFQNLRSSAALGPLRSFPPRRCPEGPSGEHGVSA
jgi:hypothetical protein